MKLIHRRPQHMPFSSHPTFKRQTTPESHLGPITKTKAWTSPKVCRDWGQANVDLADLAYEQPYPRGIWCGPTSLDLDLCPDDIWRFLPNWVPIQYLDLLPKKKSYTWTYTQLALGPATLGWYRSDQDCSIRLGLDRRKKKKKNVERGPLHPLHI